VGSILDVQSLADSIPKGRGYRQGAGLIGLSGLCISFLSMNLIILAVGRPPGRGGVALGGCLIRPERPSAFGS
jgi:hypothetical protein